MQKGTEKEMRVSGVRSCRTNIIAASTSKGIKAGFSFEGSCNTQLFTLYVKEVLCKELEIGQVVIIDNASFHKSHEVKELIEALGCKLLFLPAYSPDLNPIEKYWAVMKKKFKLLVKNGAKFLDAINEAFKLTSNFGLA